MKTLLEYLELALNLPSSEKPGLVVQGGGMRGLYSDAALGVLEELGLRDAFSLAIGSSAGGINVAYFVSGQSVGSAEIYIERLSNRHFIFPMRFWKIVDIDYLVDVALKIGYPLDVEALDSAPITPYFVATDADRCEPFIMKGRGQYDVYEVMRATAALPSLYNRRVQLGDGFYVDGGVVDSVPLEQARQLGAKRNVVLLTRSPGYRRREHGYAYRLLARSLARGQSQAIKSQLGRSDESFNRMMGELESEHQCSPSDRSTWTLWPSDERRLVSRTTAHRGRLEDCAQMARDDMRALLDQPCQVD